MAFGMLADCHMPQHPTYEDGQDIRDRSFEYACRIVGFCEALDAGGRIGGVMVPQILSSSLSFAAMLEEARAAESDNDFISKCGIALKECRESWTRLRVILTWGTTTVSLCRRKPNPTSLIW